MFNRNRVCRVALNAFVLAIGMASALGQAQQAPRTVLSADAGWKFSLGDPASAQSESFNDYDWKTVNVPHDWSIEGVPDKNLTHQAGEGYYAEGIGWYRKTFTVPSAWKGKRVNLEFDGISMNATIYLNGEKIGFHPNAYSSFHFDVTSHIKVGSRNVLAARVDNSLQPNSRWYSGSGIYRHVRFVLTDPVHVAPWGVFITTPEISTLAASAVIKTSVQNYSSLADSVSLTTQLFDPAGKKLSEVSSPVQVDAGQSSESVQDIKITTPEMWSPATPQLYRVVTQLKRKGKVVDQVENSFGVRSLSWSVDRGFLLNGTSIKFAGGSVHSDNGLLGAEAFDRAEIRKVELLKAAGFNAVRTAHNTPSPAFLDACDRLGLLVLDEAFDAWKQHKVKYDYAQYFDEWWNQDLDAMVKRDRNHPSVIMWGIGNEIPDAFTAEGAPIATKLAAHVRSLDSSRPLIEAFPGATYTPVVDAVFAQVDIGGYNYNIVQNQAADHERVPGRIMMTTESLPGDAFEQWQISQNHPYILGDFVWTAMDYLGESGVGAWSYGTAKEEKQAQQMNNFLRVMLAKIGADGKSPFTSMFEGQGVSPVMPGYPWHAAYSGDLDLTGFRKPKSYYRDILWNGGDRLFTTVKLPEPDGKKIVAAAWAVYPSLPNWTWPGQEGKHLTVEVYSGTERVRLFLNDKLVGEQATGKEQAFKASFDVPYAAGTLKAVGMRGDRIVAEETLQTAGAPVRLRVTPDRTVLTADGQDLSFVTIEAVDASGRLQQNSDMRIEVAIKGEGQLAGIGNGDGKSLDSYAGTSCTLFNGRALAIVRTSARAGVIKLNVTATGITPAQLSLKSRPASVEELR